MLETVVARVPIDCPSDKFYNFFKYSMNDIVDLFSETFTGAEIHEGQEGTEGCVKLWSYILEGTPLTAKVEIETIDDDEKSITFSVLEGDVLKLYKSFKGTLTVSEGFAEWNIEYERGSPNTPSPKPYAHVASTVSTLVDAHLLN